MVKVELASSEGSWRDVAAKIRAARKVVALTGAGISVESGIPDFRSPGGLWSIFDPMEYGTIRVFLRTPEKAWKLFRALADLLQDKLPGSAHVSLAQLEEVGVLSGVITQNIDGLHQAAGSRNVVELHGDSRHLHCVSCGLLRPVEAEDSSRQPFPQCSDCGAPLKPNVVLFGELIRNDDAASRLLAGCDCLLVIGTSAEVYPAAEYPRQVARRGGSVIEFNVEVTCLTPEVDFLVIGQAGRTLPRLLDAMEL